jgi:hypothetical protein
MRQPGLLELPNQKEQTAKHSTKTQTQEQTILQLNRTEGLEPNQK